MNRQIEVVEVVRLLDANKAKVAFLAPVAVATLSTIASWVVTGDFSDSEIRTAVSGALLGLAAGISTFFANAGTAEVKPLEGSPHRTTRQR